MGNEPARRLYARLGFVEYGIERNSLKHGGRYYDEILMAKDLTPASYPLAATDSSDAAPFAMPQSASELSPVTSST
jgi:hypothetical protein